MVKETRLAFGNGYVCRLVVRIQHGREGHILCRYRGLKPLRYSLSSSVFLFYSSPLWPIVQNVSLSRLSNRAKSVLLVFECGPIHIPMLLATGFLRTVPGPVPAPGDESAAYCESGLRPPLLMGLGPVILRAVGERFEDEPCVCGSGVSCIVY